MRISASMRPEDHPEDLGDHGDVDRREERRSEGAVDTEDAVPERVPVECCKHLGRSSRRSVYLPFRATADIFHFARIDFIVPSAYIAFTCFCTFAISGSPLRIAIPTGIGFTGEPANPNDESRWM